MQAINPVDVHVENEWHEESDHAQKLNRKGHQTSRMRTRVFNKVKTKKSKALLSPSPRIPKQVVVPTLVLPVRSRSSSPNRGPWVPPPGRSTRGQKLSWQSPKSRLEINPVTEILVDDDESLSAAREKQNVTNNSQTNTLSTVENDKLIGEIQIYEKRIQGLIDGIGMLKDRIHNHANQEQTDQLRSDIDSSLLELEQLQENYTQRIPTQPSKTSRSPSPTRVTNNHPHRSSSADEQRPKRTTPSKVSFQDDPVIERRRARSTTPVRGPIYLNPDREQLLISLADSEADIAQITKQLSSVKDILTKLKFDDQAVSFEVEQLHQHRNELLHLIEQFERSNKQLTEYLHHQYHLEAEHGLIHEQYDTLKTTIHGLQHENDQIRRLLLERENDNIALQTELERIRTHAIGFDTMKTSLENNRAHLQRELYAKEGEIGRLQCALRSLERDLQRSRFHSDQTRRPGKRPPTLSTLSRTTTKSKPVVIERLPAESTDAHPHGNLHEQPDETLSETDQLRRKLEHAEQLAHEYQAQLHTQTLKNSASNSKNHLSELELDKVRARLQKRIEELSPLPELLKQAETENERLQKQNNELKKRASDPSTLSTHIVSPDDDHQRTLQRRITALEEQNEQLSKALRAKEDELRTGQSRPSPSVNPQIDFTKTNFKTREDPYGSRTSLGSNHWPNKSAGDLEQQISRLRLEHDQLKREKDELEQRFTSQFNELREKLEQSHNRNRGMQNYINSLKTTYTTLFSDTLPTSSARYTTT